jgi:hypothetical protein
MHDWPDVGPRTEQSDSCGEFFEHPNRVQLNAATVVNFLIGLLAVPLILTLSFRVWNREHRLVPPGNAVS